jgi:hypothetical protein
MRRVEPLLALRKRNPTGLIVALAVRELALSLAKLALTVAEGAPPVNKGCLLVPFSKIADDTTRPTAITARPASRDRRISRTLKTRSPPRRRTPRRRRATRS